MSVSHVGMRIFDKTGKVLLGEWVGSEANDPTRLNKITHYLYRNKSGKIIRVHVNAALRSVR